MTPQLGPRLNPNGRPGTNGRRITNNFAFGSTLGEWFYDPFFAIQGVEPIQLKNSLVTQDRPEAAMSQNQVRKARKGKRAAW